ncbi:MAG: hypothetical protein FLDDKLPJ_03700 [Phycisphaerae bacterium]|nr:hypothetical protein [Phycisphaerae bacterium]
MTANRIPILEPSLQVAFFFHLREIREKHLAQALAQTVKSVDIALIDGELNQLVNPDVTRRIASFGLRGELVVPVPLLMRANPFLLGYYRLLYGMSQKEFYQKGPFGAFRSLEETGRIGSRIDGRIEDLCRSLIGTGEKLVSALDNLTLEIIHELQLLTIGPQLRGSENTRIGEKATRLVRSLVERIVKPHLQEATNRTILLKNAAGRMVMIEFLDDPDVRIVETLPSGVRRIVSIEIKGGGDVSNVHNRLGEAEKSHLKAKNEGFNEFWTIVRAKVNDESARRDSPTTSRFFDLSRICNSRSADYRSFRDLLSSLVGI